MRSVEFYQKSAGVQLLEHHYHVEKTFCFLMHEHAYSFPNQKLSPAYPQTQCGLNLYKPLITSTLARLYLCVEQRQVPSRSFLTPWRLTSKTAADRPFCEPSFPQYIPLNCPDFLTVHRYLEGQAARGRGKWMGGTLVCFPEMTAHAIWQRDRMYV